MKILVSIVGVLAVTMTVYSLDAERLQMFTDNLTKCSKELGESPSKPSAEAVKCALVMDGRLLNANGEYIKEAAMKGLEDVISDTARLEKAQGIFTKCYEEALQSGATGNEQTMKIVTCSMPILPLLSNSN